MQKSQKTPAMVKQAPARPGKALSPRLKESVREPSGTNGTEKSKRPANGTNEVNRAAATAEHNHLELRLEKAVSPTRVDDLREERKTELPITRRGFPDTGGGNARQCGQGSDTRVRVQVQRFNNQVLRIDGNPRTYLSLWKGALRVSMMKRRRGSLSVVFQFGFEIHTKS